jgi:5-methyltetrahydrofolate--homocysteine methyltransferase
MTEILEDIYEGILDGDRDAVTEGVQEALDEGVSPEKILKEGLIAAMGEVGRLYEEGEYFVPEMLIAARAMQAGLQLLKPHLVDTDIKPTGKVVIGTVQGDLHDIGKNLVAMMMEGAGFEIVDLGTDVPASDFVTAVTENDANIVALSALLTTTMPQQQSVIDALVEAGMRDQVKVLVGGAPVTSDYAEKIGADGYAPDAGQAAQLAKKLSDM